MKYFFICLVTWVAAVCATMDQDDRHTEESYRQEVEMIDAWLIEWGQP